MKINKISEGNWLFEIADVDKKKLACIINELKNKTELPPYGIWKEMSSEDIWEEMLAQFCVMGSAKPIEKLQENAVRYNQFLDRLDLKTLSRLTADRRGYIAKQLRRFKATRFYNKTAARINEFLANEKVVKGERLVLFDDIESEMSEDKMRDVLLEKQSCFKIKSISDLMITIGASKSFIAFDTRVVGLFNKHFGLNIKVGKIQSDEILYKTLENNLREVCTELKIDLSLLDRVLFKYNSAIDYILEVQCG